jgi:exopolyphosphatase / guanosine-5'-triphosphate,3'-diphosphate pyrophosphatase
MKKASIDIGSNTVLLLIADINDKEIYELENESRVTALGKDIDKTKEFAVESMEDTFSALSEYREMINTYNISNENIIVTATEASRVVNNSKNFFSRIKKDLSFDIQLISPEGEAYYTSLGAQSNLPNEITECLILDIGGASTEIIDIEINPFSIKNFISIPFGSVRATDWRNDGVFDQNMEQSFSSFKMEIYIGKKMIGVAGTVTSLAMMLSGEQIFEASRINDTTINKGELVRLIDEIKDMSHLSLQKSFPFLGKRVSTIQGGAYVLLKLFNRLKIDELIVSTYGLRYGTILSEGVNKRFLG